MSVVTTEVAKFLDRATSVFLAKEETEKLALIYASNKEAIGQISVEEQTAILNLCMQNFGIFVVSAMNCSVFPDPLRYALVSKAMYNFGACDVPEGLEPQVNALLALDKRSWWSHESTEDAIYNFREFLLSNPVVGLEPLVGEFDSSGDVSLVYAMLQNPLLPLAKSQQIASRNHGIFNIAGEADLDQLVELAEENLSS